MGTYWGKAKKEYIRLKNIRAQKINAIRKEIRSKVEETPELSIRELNRMGTKFIANRLNYVTKAEREALEDKHKEEHKRRVHMANQQRRMDKLRKKQKRRLKVCL